MWKLELAGPTLPSPLIIYYIHRRVNTVVCSFSFKWRFHWLQYLGYIGHSTWQAVHFLGLSESPICQVSPSTIMNQIEKRQECCDVYQQSIRVMTIIKHKQRLDFAIAKWTGNCSWPDPSHICLSFEGWMILVDFIKVRGSREICWYLWFAILQMLRTGYCFWKVFASLHS